MAASDVVELVVSATAGAVAALGGTATIPIGATPIGQAFRDGTPRRFDNVDLEVGGGTVLRLCYPFAPATRSQALSLHSGTKVHTRSALSSSR